MVIGTTLSALRLERPPRIGARLSLGFLAAVMVAACSGSITDNGVIPTRSSIVSPPPVLDPPTQVLPQADQPPVTQSSSPVVSTPIATRTTPLSTSTASPTGTPTQTIVSPAVTPTQTIVSPTATPTRTAVSSSAIDDRFGLIASGPARDWQVQNLGSTWFIDFNSDTADAPSGTNKVPFIQVAPRSNRVPPSDLEILTARAPGSYWYIGGEPNVAQQGNMSPEAFVDEFDYYATEIRAADPLARIMGPSILNWDFTCTGCGGFTSGETWMRAFIDAYAVKHAGKSPPVAVWSIDAYPLTWNSVPMTDWELVRDQILGFRQFLALEVPEHSKTPIWVTELASHWAFPEWVIENNALAIPPDLDINTDYAWDEMEGYMDGILGWLKNQGPVHNIERWFLFKGYVDIAESSKEGYAGIYLYENGNEGSPLNRLGKVYQDYILGIR